MPDLLGGNASDLSEGPKSHGRHFMSSAFDIAGQTAVVTGGGRGLGLGITTALLDAGVAVHVLSRRPPDERII